MMYVVIIISILMICLTVIIVKGLDVITENPELLTKIKKNEKSKLQFRVPVNSNTDYDWNSPDIPVGSDFDIDNQKNK